ncbi:MAG: hypothetical protein V3U12_00600 [Nitrosopumilaceae archaeon]
MQNVTIVVLILTTCLVLLGSLNFAEGAVSWNGFLREIGFNPPTVYEVSAVSTIQAGEIFGNEVQLGCLEGDIFPSLNRLVTLSIDDPTIDTTNLLITKLVISVEENDEIFSDFSSKLIRVDVKARHDAGSSTQLFDVPVTITIVCLSPSSFMTVGGEWQATDTTALIIGYSVLNAYWLAPIGIGIGLGLFLVKRNL